MITFLNYLMAMPSITKKAIVLAVDLVAITGAIWCAFALRYSEWWPVARLEAASVLLVLIPIMSLVVFEWLGFYRTVVRFIGLDSIRTIVLGSMLLSLVTYALTLALPVIDVSKSLPIIFGLCVCLYLCVSRLLFRDLYLRGSNLSEGNTRIVIFGAGAAGAQLLQSCRADRKFLPIAFVDEDQSMWGREVSGLQVLSPKALPTFLKKQKIDMITLAIPSASAQNKSRIIKLLTNLQVPVRTMPTLQEILEGEPVDNIRNVAIEDLLGRNAVQPDKYLLRQSLDGKNVCITGAGGSIGSELARQSLLHGAATVLLYEQSEYALYSIERELKETLQRNQLEVSIVPILGSVLDQERLQQSLVKFKIQTFYHAAAYKHVPIVEHNVLQGIINNAFGTESAALAAEHAGVDRFILVSTDKAVRPTNVMGATKRLAELLLQDRAADPNSKVIFSMVRFGNVLDSSGSVVPLFKRQLRAGGPLTVTHPKVTRYFMTISEAASLVLQAGSLAKGGEVFVLDMGLPIKILDLAKTMIRVSGLNIKDEGNPSGDISIKFTGLRPGEKLYEELLVGSDAKNTKHPKIMCAKEDKLGSLELNNLVEGLREAISKSDPNQAKYILSKTIDGYDPKNGSVDWLAAKS